MSAPPLILLDPHPRTAAMVYDDATAAQLAGLGTVVAHFGSRAPDAFIDEHLPEAEVVIGQPAMPAERLRRAKRLRAIINVKGNWEPTLDYGEAQRLGIHVLSAAPAMAPAVAEYCLGQAISLARRLPARDADFRRGQERYGIAGNQDATTLYGAAVGMVGFGNVGRQLARLLAPFDCQVLVYDPWLSDGFLAEHKVQPASLEQLLGESRFLFLLASPTAEPDSLLDAGRLELIGDDACVVLASRAEIVDFDKLVELGATGRLRVAIDVYPQEPVPAGAPCREAGSIHFTAHLAGGLHHSYALIRQMMLDDVRQVLKGLPPLRLQQAQPRLAGLMRSR